MYDDLTAIEKVSNLIDNPKMQTVKINTYVGNRGETRNFYLENVNNLIGCIDIILKYRDTIASSECSNFSNYNDEKSRDTLSNKCFELYTRNKIEKPSATFLAELILYNKNPSYIIENIDTNILLDIETDNALIRYNLLRDLFYKNDPSINKAFSRVFKQGLQLSSIIVELIHKSKRELSAAITRLGGIESIKNRIPKRDTGFLLAETPTENLPIIAALIPRENYKLFSDYEIKSLFTNCPRGESVYNIIRLKLMFKILGKETIINKLTGGALYSILEYAQGLGEEIQYTPDQLIQEFITIKDGMIETTGYNNELVAILTYANDPQKMLSLIKNKNIINELSTDTVKSILDKIFYKYKNKIDKFILIMDILGTRNLNKMINNTADQELYTLISYARKTTYFVTVVKYLSFCDLPSKIIYEILIQCIYAHPYQINTIFNLLGKDKLSLLGAQNIKHLMTQTPIEIRELVKNNLIKFLGNDANITPTVNDNNKSIYKRFMKPNLLLL